MVQAADSGVTALTAAAQLRDGSDLVPCPGGQERQMTTQPPQISPTDGRTTSQGGFTLIELLIVVAMIAVLATIAFPILLRARITSNEGVAVASLRTIHSAQASFAATCGAGGYAQTLADLEQKPPGAAVGFIQEPYTANGVIVNGYVANLMAASDAATMLDSGSTCNGASMDAVTSFVVERHPVSVGETGVRSFAIDTQGTLHMRMDGDPIDDALTDTLIFQ
jgi:prepilin-type N-terminal cleavage/methylation domain-containing protein